MPRISASGGRGEPQSTVAEYTPVKGKTNKSAKTTNRAQLSEALSHPSSSGATLKPSYAERTPKMWAVGDVDIRAISDDNLVANIAFGIGSFCLGFAANIFLTYVGVQKDKLTELGAFFFYKGTAMAIVAALFFYVVGGIMSYRKKAIWEQIKRETQSWDSISDRKVGR